MAPYTSHNATATHKTLFSLFYCPASASPIILRLDFTLRWWSMLFSALFFFFNDTPTTEIYTLSLHDALPISRAVPGALPHSRRPRGHRAFSAADPGDEQPVPRVVRHHGLHRGPSVPAAPETGADQLGAQGSRLPQAAARALAAPLRPGGRPPPARRRGPLSSGRCPGGDPR